MLKEEIILVGRAEYIPVPEIKEVKDISENTKVDNTYKENMDKSEKPIFSVKNTNESSEWEYRVSDKIDTSWRDKISEIASQNKNKIQEIKPIEVTRSKNSEEEKRNEKKINTVETDVEKETISYFRKMQAVIRSHWSVPEDIALRYGNKPVEVEIEIDFTGALKSYKFINSSGNNIYDASIKEAIKKSFPFIQPPKNLFQNSLDNAKIKIVFRL